MRRNIDRGNIGQGIIGEKMSGKQMKVYKVQYEGLKLNHVRFKEASVTSFVNL